MQNNLILATYRVENKITLKKMAKILNVSLSTYKLYETGIVPMKLEELNTFCNYFNLSLNYLLNFTNIPNADNFRTSIDYKYLKFSLRLFRRQARITQKELAKEFNVSIYSISKYEKDAKHVSLNYLYLFAKKFKVSADYLCGKTLDRNFNIKKR